MARKAGSIGILGSGAVGGSLATGFADSGHEVLLGSRDPGQARLAEWASADRAHRRLGTYREAANFGEIVIFAVPGRVLGETLDAVGRDAFGGALVIDATNPVAYTDEGVVGAYGDDDSGAEFLQRELAGVPVVKAFNQINAADMLTPARSENPRLRIAGDDEGAKQRVTQLLEAYGWTVRDLGPLTKARALEQGVVDWVRRSQGA